MFNSTSNGNKGELARFFNTLFYGFNSQAESIRIITSKQNGYFDSPIYFNDITKLCAYVDNDMNVCGRNTYFTLATTDGNGGKTDNLKRRYFLAFDFDEKELGDNCNKIEILNRFRNIGVFYNCIISSGHGFHVYVLIEPTENIELVVGVEKAIASLVGADMHAVKPTQLLRVPFTYNVKESIKKVVLIHLDNEDDKAVIKRDTEIEINKINRRNIDWYKNKFLHSSTEGKTHIDYVLKSTELPECIKDMLKNGSKEGDRYNDLCDLVVILRNRKKSLAEIKLIAKDWGKFSNYNENIEYQVENIYKNKNWSNRCSGCIYTKECYRCGGFSYKKDENDVVIDMPEKHISKIKVSKRKDAKVMEANALLVYSILRFYKLHNRDASREDIIRILTYDDGETKKVALSNTTLSNALKSLENNGFIEVYTGSDRCKLYKAVEVNASKDFIYSISFNATLKCRRGEITAEELKLYNYMRYLHNKAKRENPDQQKDDTFQINQELLAKDLGITQSRVSKVIKKLLLADMLLILYKGKSKTTGFEYNVYVFTC